ncbi:MAG: UDP-N-acetylmuramoyl-tripeptide--D-alanyl-D-alanine ligase [Lachnospiraceae bacterium]|nr:UDP-N-acetylmuramoyl-tripeptide--D-alanyl-D-alanine ligase [Lachnospiraceae bacterium]
MPLLIISLVITIYAYLMIRFGIHMFQQNGYKNKVHVKWINANRVRCYTGPFDMKPSKKPLVYTPRVVRLFVTTVLIFSVCCIANRFIGSNVTLLVFVAVYTFVLGPFLPVISNIINSPIEKSIANGFIKKAMGTLAKMDDLTVIGITGSYGKTSVKFYLETLLSSEFEVLATPESYNTPMGVVKTINEHMKPTHRIFLCEMGARNVGDIKELCDIVHPKHGIITSVGAQHLESFKTQENITKTKFELADALPEDGMLFLNYDSEIIREHNKNTSAITYSTVGNGKYNADDIVTSINGTTFTVTAPDGEKAQFTTKLIGSHNVVNVVGAIAVANSLGISLEKLKIPVRTLRPVEHRLNMTEKNGITIIDDAYNSNPAGAKAALDTLSMFEDAVKILITPGMVELGEKEDELNEVFGRQAAVSADYILLVGKKHTEPIAKGIKEEGFDEKKLYIEDSFNDALTRVYSIPGEQHKVLLIENDLPDNYQEK